jgi:hypothetical protein
VSEGQTVHNHKPILAEQPHRNRFGCNKRLRRKISTGVSRRRKNEEHHNITMITYLCFNQLIIALINWAYLINKVHLYSLCPKKTFLHAIRCANILSYGIFKSRFHALIIYLKHKIGHRREEHRF